MITPTDKKLEPGDVLHWRRSGIIFRISESSHAASEVSQRADCLTITPAIIAASTDRNGAHSWLDLVDDDEAQIRRWGSVVFARGVAPDDLTVYEPHTTEQDSVYSERRTAAWAVRDPQERAEALASLQAEFGLGPLTSKTVRTERGSY